MTATLIGLEKKMQSSLDESTQVPLSHCWNCGEPIDMTTGPTTPKPGDLSICGVCGELSLFTEDMHLRTLTLDEYLTCAKDRDVRRLRQAIAKIREAE